MCVLHLLAGRPFYGYELMKTLQEAFPDVYDGSIYAVLRRLNDDDCTETFLGETSGGPPRKYYRLTGTGRARLDEALAEWRSLFAAVRSLGIAD
jgi:PadR family transcriptional regulator PadR